MNDCNFMSGGKRYLGDDKLLTGLERILDLRVLTRTIRVLKDAPV